MGVSDDIALRQAGNAPAHRGFDLDLFQRIVDDIFEECASCGSLSLNEKKYLSEQLAAAIFRSAEAGEHDYTRLKQSAIDAVAAVPHSGSGS